MVHLQRNYPRELSCPRLQRAATGGARGDGAEDALHAFAPRLEEGVEAGD